MMKDVKVLFQNYLSKQLTHCASTFAYICYNFFQGVKLFNMEEQKLLRHITCDYATDVHIRGNILMICGNVDMSTKSYMVKYEQKRIATHRFWKLSELIDSSLKIEEVSQRSKYTY